MEGQATFYGLTLLHPWELDSRYKLLNKVQIWTYIEHTNSDRNRIQLKLKYRKKNERENLEYENSSLKKIFIF